VERKTIWKGSTRVGEDVITTDREGLTHIAHYDSHNSLVGRSYETRDYKGEVYMVHEDARGNRLGRSTVERDWWGDYYVKTEQSRFTREKAEAERREKEKSKKRTVPQEENDDHESSPVVDLLYGLVMIGIKIFIALMGYVLVAMASMPLAIEILMTVLNNTGNTGLGWFGVFSIITISYFPYIGILLYRRWKKEINWKDFFLAVLRWAIIGPFAYRWLLGKEKEKTTKEYDPHRPYDLPLWQCPACGKNIFTAGQFCPDCGTKRPDEPSFYTKFCPNCGKPIKVIPGEKTGVCSDCGYVYSSKQK